MTLAERTKRILAEAKYLSLSTVSDHGLPWTAVLQYAWLEAPLRFLFGSATESHHSRNIAVRPRVSGALYLSGTLTEVDGAQFTGTCVVLSANEVAKHHQAFYDAVLPDEALRAEYTLPVAELLPPAPHRIYQVTVDHWWLVDTSTWIEDRIDRRIEVPISELGG